MTAPIQPLSLKVIKYVAFCTIIGLLSGCVTTERHQVNCAWCKAPVENNVYSWDQMSKRVSVMVWNLSGTRVVEQRIIGSANTLPEAKELMRQDEKKYGIHYDGCVFDCRKCVTAYTASKEHGGAVDSTYHW